MAYVSPWSDPKKELGSRLDNAKKARRDQEVMWNQVDYILYGELLPSGQSGVITGSNGTTTVGTQQFTEVDQSSSAISITYAFKNLRFIHAQLSANAPAVASSPNSGDVEDLRRADAADRLVRYALRQYRMQEYFDICGNSTLHYGTAFIKTLWNKELGAILSCDPVTGEIKTEGDFEATVIHPRRMFIDPEADCEKNIRYYFEEKILPYEQALYMFGEEKIDLLELARKKELDDYSGQKKFDVVKVFEYWETGLPLNGYAGKYCVCGEDGTPFTDIVANPFAFARAGGGAGAPKKARLPYHIFTDIDVPGKVWGKSFLDFVIRPQDVLNRLDSAVLDNLESHGVFRMVLPEGCDVDEGSITNVPKQIIKYTGTQPPFFIGPPQMTPDMSTYRTLVKQGIDDMSGVNESMFGQQSRETAGFAMQYAVNQGSMIRRRLFNKFTMLTENVYRAYLDIIRENWVIPRLVTVMGKENALEAVDIKGADIDGGYDLTLSYGTNLSIDPLTRRQEIIQYQPLFEKAGVTPRQSLELMKLNDLSGFYDCIQLAKLRQREYFEKMIATKKYVPPELFEDHVNMIAYAREYRMTQEFTALEPETKNLIYKHIVERAKMPQVEQKLLAGEAGPGPQVAGEAAATGQGAPAGPGGPAGTPIAPPPQGAPVPPMPAPGGAPGPGGGLPPLGQP